MDVSQQVWLMIAMSAMGLWKPMGWVLVICGIGVMSMALDLMDSDSAAFAMPYLFLGVGQFLLGIFRARITGK